MCRHFSSVFKSFGYCLYVSTLKYHVSTLDHLFLNFILCSHVSTLHNHVSILFSSLDIVFMCRYFKPMCRHFKYNFLTVQMCLHFKFVFIKIYYWSQVSTLPSPSVDTYYLILGSLLTYFRYRHFLYQVSTLLTRIYFFDFLGYLSIDSLHDLQDFFSMDAYDLQ